MKLTELPNLTFASADPTETGEYITTMVEYYLGRKLARADPIRLFLRGIEALIVQQNLLIDECAKQNLLAYARGANLEHIGALVGVTRLPAQYAKCTMQTRLSAARSVTTTIPKGIRFTAGDQIYFELDEDIVFLAGEVEKTGSATCLTEGTVGNGYAIGEIRNVVDPQPFLQSAMNITESDGGSDIESDDALRERIHEAPESFSNAGSTGAYRWHTFNASPLISDVSIVSPSPGVVNIYPLLKGGELPTTEVIELVDQEVNDRTVRPLTDKVEVICPNVVPFTVNLKYWIARSDAISTAIIIEKANQAVRDYILWQKSVLGRDIEPTELIYRLRAAGVKRVELLTPVFTVVDNKSVAVAEYDGQLIKYMGLEDD